METDGKWLLNQVKKGFLLLLCLLAMGWGTRLLEEPAWQKVKASQPEHNLEGLKGALGQGVIVGLLGGFRTIIADFIFIKANVHWEKQEREKTEFLLNLVTEIDPRPVFFWLNGARMIAYDIPVWRINEMGGSQKVPKAMQEKIIAEQTYRGLAMIERAEAFHSEDYRIPLEKAQFYINRLKDTEKAAEWYRITALYEGAPYFAGRIYAQLLRDLGRQDEAYRYLIEHYKELPDNEPSAVKPVVLGRIRELEHELKIPASLIFPYQPSERLNQLPEGVEIGPEHY